AAATANLARSFGPAVISVVSPKSPPPTRSRVVTLSDALFDVRGRPRQTNVRLKQTSPLWGISASYRSLWLGTVNAVPAARANMLFGTGRTFRPAPAAHPAWSAPLRLHAAWYQLSNSSGTAVRLSHRQLLQHSDH